MSKDRLARLLYAGSIGGLTVFAFPFPWDFLIGICITLTVCTLAEVFGE